MIEFLRAFRRFPAVALLAVVLGPQAAAQDEAGPLAWGFSFRTRFESRQDFNFADSSQDYLLSRTRLNLNWRANEVSNVYVELQDARIAGEDGSGVPRINDKAKGTIFADELDIHQAYWDRNFESGRLRVGRQKFNLGDSRLVASLEWVNTARVHDGIRYTWSAGEREIDLFASTLVAVEPESLNDHAPIGNRRLDSDLHGIFVTDPASISGWDLNYWYLHRRNSRAGDKVDTIGIRFVHKEWTWRPDLQFAVQGGDFNGLDHSAWMAHIGVQRAMGRGQLRLLYNFASGDPRPGDGKHETFDNLYGFNHPYYGYMDLFSLQNIRNFEASYQRQIGEATSVYVSFNDFRLAESNDAWYNAGLVPIRITSMASGREVGQEIDIAVRTRIAGGRVSVDAGVSMLRGGSYLDTFGLDGNAEFLYLSFLYSASW